MRNIARIFLDDVRFATGNIVGVLVLLGLCLVPVMYAWFNIAGSWDPYGNTHNLKVAVANGDAGYKSDLVSVRVNIGDRVMNQLRGNDDYGWTFTSEDDAVDGVKSGEYYAAVVIPADFSEKLMTVFTSDAEKASVDYYLNLKENPIAPVIAGEGEAELLEDIRVKFTEAVDAMTVDVASDLVSFMDSGKTESFGVQLVKRLDEVADGLDTTAEQVRAFAGLVDATSSFAKTGGAALAGSGEVNGEVHGIIAELASDLSDAVDAVSSSVAKVRREVDAADSSDGLGGVGTSTASKLASDASSLASSVDSIAGSAEEASESLDKTVQTLAGSTDSLSSELVGVRSTLGAAANRLGAASSKIRAFQSDLSNAVLKGDTEAIGRIVGGNSSSLAQWLSAPVQVEKHEVYPVANYGSSMAPFYTILSIWVGAVVLVALVKTGVSEQRVRRMQEQRGRPVRNYELYLGRYGIFLALSLVQATIVALGDLLFLRIQCVHPLLFLAACWACAFVFSSIVYTFALSFGEIGKALCIILLVMQVAGSGGEYPIQMMGDFFQAVYPFLPFTHGMRAMQEAIAGVYGMEYAYDLLKLAAFLLPSLLLGLVLRRPVIRAAAAFNRKLEQTGLM